MVINMKANFRNILLIGALIITKTTISHALTFQNVSHESYYNEPLRVTVVVENATEEKLKSLEVRVGEQRLLAQMGLTDSMIWDDINVGITPLSNGKAKLVFASNKPLTASSIDFLAEFRWDGSYSQKVYTFDIPKISPEEFTTNWVNAWSSGDVNKYLSLYSKSFIPSGSLAKATWERQRRQRVKPDLNIQISLDDINVERSNNRARVSFHQAYKSRTFQNTTNKYLDLVLEDNEWRIAREVVK